MNIFKSLKRYIKYSFNKSYDNFNLSNFVENTYMNLFFSGENFNITRMNIYNGFIITPKENNIKYTFTFKLIDPLLFERKSKYDVVKKDIELKVKIHYLGNLINKTYRLKSEKECTDLINGFALFYDNKYFTEFYNRFNMWDNFKVTLNFYEKDFYQIPNRFNFSINVEFKDEFQGYGIKFVSEFFIPFSRGLNGTKIDSIDFISPNVTESIYLNFQYNGELKYFNNKLTNFKSELKKIKL